MDRGSVMTVLREQYVPEQYVPGYDVLLSRAVERRARVMVRSAPSRSRGLSAAL